jgi:hypothetical protein
MNVHLIQTGSVALRESQRSGCRRRNMALACSTTDAGTDSADCGICADRVFARSRSGVGSTTGRPANGITDNRPTRYSMCGEKRRS